MTLDPNWFYSSLAQSAAAIVGIVGSVLIVRLQSQLETARRNKEQFLRTFLECRGRWLTLASSMIAFMEYIDRTRPLVAQALERGEAQLQVGEEIHFVGSRGGSPWLMPISPETLANFEHEKKAASLLANAVSTLSKVQDLHDLVNHFSSFEGLRNVLPKEAHSIVEGVVNDLRRQVQPIERHTIQTSVWTSIVLTVVLAWLCVFGLLIPLTYLSAYADLHKYLLTSAFAVAVIALPAVMGFQIKEVRTAAWLLVAPEDVLP